MAKKVLEETKGDQTKKRKNKSTNEDIYKFDFHTIQ